MSHVTCPMSHVTCHIYPVPNANIQRPLHRLVYHYHYAQKLTSLKKAKKNQSAKKVFLVQYTLQNTLLPEEQEPEEFFNSGC